MANEIWSFETALEKSGGGRYFRIDDDATGNANSAVYLTEYGARIMYGGRQFGWGFDPGPRDDYSKYQAKKRWLQLLVQQRQTAYEKEHHRLTQLLLDQRKFGVPFNFDDLKEGLKELKALKIAAEKEYEDFTREEREARAREDREEQQRMQETDLAVSEALQELESI